MTKEQAEKVIAGIEEWWQERRATCAMDTETHNREHAQVEALKEKIRAMIIVPDGNESGKNKP